MVTWQTVTILCLLTVSCKSVDNLKCHSSHQKIGQTGRLVCEVQIEEADRLLSITWYKCHSSTCKDFFIYNAEKNNTIVKGGLNTNRLAHSYKNGLVLLLLYNTTKDDEGRYEVKVRSEKDDHFSQVYYVVDDKALGYMLAGPKKRLGSAIETETRVGNDSSEKTTHILGVLLAVALCAIVFLLIGRRTNRVLWCLKRRRRDTPTKNELKPMLKTDEATDKGQQLAVVRSHSVS